MNDNFRGLISGKKLVAFGTGKACEDLINKLGAKSIDYFVDNNRDKQGMVFMGRQIYSPDVLLREKRGQVYIIIASMYCEEMSQQLNKMGFQEKQDYYYDYMVDFTGNELFCPCCGRSYNRFLPYGIVSRENALCPGCSSLERHRFLWLYMEEYLKNLSGRMNILHVAPEKVLQKKLLSYPDVNYISVDLNSPSAMLKMDITDICFKDDYFDIIICNHVLEHILDDAKAMGELFRVLSAKGTAIITVPQNRQLESTYEDPKIILKEDRLRCFGQDDHVRIYGMDFSERLKKTGFAVSIYSVAEHYSDEQIKKYGLLKDEKIFLCRKENT